MSESEGTPKATVVVAFGRSVTGEDLETLKATEDVVDAFEFPGDVHIHINWDGGGFHWPPVGDPAV
jgi:hypothetical protein